MASVNDIEVLNNIFNPLLPMGGLLFDENITNEAPEEDEVISKEIETAKSLELEAIKASEKENFEQAVELLTQAIKLAPNRASGFNNRAQALRLLGKIEEAKDDLNNAINISFGKGRAACQAYCQRGLINLKENKTEYAKMDFEAATKLGSQFAKAQLVNMNPYAALCNKMLRGVFDKLQRGQPTNDDVDAGDMKN